MRTIMKQLETKVLMIGVIALAALPACTQAPSIPADDSLSSLSGYSANSAAILNVSSSGSQIAFNQYMQFSASGGALPYVYTVDGPGTIDADTGYFQAGTTEGLVTVTAMDFYGRSGTASVYVSATGVGSSGSSSTTTYRQGVINLSLSQAYGGCIGGSFNEGSIAIGYGYGYSAGDQQLCVAKASLTATSFVYGDIQVTPPGAHGANVACPNGYSQVAAIPDCSGGICAGSQLICAQPTTVNAVSNYVTNFFVTSEGQHLPTGATCPSGYISAGSTIDCGGGVCSGYQTFCKTY